MSRDFDCIRALAPSPVVVVVVAGADWRPAPYVRSNRT